VRRPDFARTPTFYSVLTVASALLLCTVVLFGFVYKQATVYVLNKYDVLLVEELQVFASNTPERLLQEIEDRLLKDPQRIKIAGLFGADGSRIAGNIEALPSGLTPNIPTNAVVVRLDRGGRKVQNVRLAERSLSSGESLVIGRQIDEITEIAQIVVRTLALGLLPAFIVTVLIGMFLSQRVYLRVTELNRQIQHVATSDLHERLPTSGRGDTFDQIAASINRMLGDIESLVREIASVGDNIAHDLRTPLTRVRVRLERGRANASTLNELRAVVDQAIAGLDQSLAIITALLRIAEIEHSRRLEGFSQVPLGPLAREVCDLYEPIAEDKGVALRVECANDATVRGDRDLLFEAVANLVDNAIKFTPKGGHVDISLLLREGEAVIQIRDTGPGISEIEREAVTKRFYRSDKSRRTEGLGLGLSLVAAIVKLHGFQFSIAAGPGCTVEIICPQTALKANASDHCAVRTALNRGGWHSHNLG
jgi:signal transduction histidine kinase